MTPASKPANVIEALSAVMADLPAIGKDSKASPQQGGYAYRGIEAITQHTQTLFAKHGVVFIPRVVSYEVREITVNDKPWTDVYEMVEYTVYGPGGIEDRIVVGPILAIGRDNSDKGGNKCLTQAYKYALIQALCISDAKDDSDVGAPEADKRVPKPRPENVTDLLATKRAALGKVATDEKIDASLAGRLIGEWYGEGKVTKDLESIQLDSAAEGFRRYAATRREVAALAGDMNLTDDEVLLVAAGVWAPDEVPKNLGELSDKELTALRDELKNRKTEAK